MGMSIRENNWNGNMFGWHGNGNGTETYGNGKEWESWDYSRTHHVSVYTSVRQNGPIYFKQRPKCSTVSPLLFHYTLTLKVKWRKWRKCQNRFGPYQLRPSMAPFTSTKDQKRFLDGPPDVEGWKVKAQRSRTFIAVTPPQTVRLTLHEDQHAQQILGNGADYRGYYCCACTAEFLVSRHRPA